MIKLKGENTKKKIHSLPRRVLYTSKHTQLSLSSKNKIKLDTISLRATRRSSVWFWCNQSKRWTNELQFRFRVWGNLLIQFVVSTVSECIWEVSYRLMSTQSQLFRQVMKPTGRLLGLEKLNIFMSYQNIYQLLIATNNHIVRSFMEFNKLKNCVRHVLTYCLPVEIYWYRQ